MMSKKQWFVLLCVFVMYLLLGAGIFFNIEQEEESLRIDQLKLERQNIEKILQGRLGTFITAETNAFLKNLSDYCGKPLSLDMTSEPIERKWDFYHALFFVITVVSTIGYGNLSPTTTFTRIFMIFYGLIGIPMNGIVMLTLGDFFGKSFTKLYHRWKTAKMQYDAARLGLISQIILYLVPGFTFFIFLPSVIMSYIENWTYDEAVYFAFVTLTTIGFGDFVAGASNVNNNGPGVYWFYKIFLLVWVIGGLGYVVMILGFITQAMRSKKMQELEHKITQNIKKTPIKIRQELRSLLQEFLFLRVKPVYKGEFEYTPHTIVRSQSCPDLTIYRNLDSPTMTRKRALSECPRTFILARIQSDTDLEAIDKELTFPSSEEFQHQKELIQKVVDALNLEEPSEAINQHVYEGFSDHMILASERFNSQWSLNSNNIQQTPPQKQRRRAVSEYKVPHISNLEPEVPVVPMEQQTWYGPDVQNLQFRSRTFSEPTNTELRPPKSFLSKLKNKLIPSTRGEDAKALDIEKQELDQTNRRRGSYFSSDQDRYLRRTSRGRVSVLSTQNQDRVLEQTSIADFIRALSAITVPDVMTSATSGATGAGPKRKMGTAGLSPPKMQSPQRTRRLAIRPNLQVRRTSLMPTESLNTPLERRRYSLRPVDENLLAPPPYSPPRKFSRAVNYPSTTGTFSPVQRQVISKKDKDETG